MPTPDTSNANVAAILRICADYAERIKWIESGVPSPVSADIRALADALDAQAVSQKPLWGALTEDDWKTREDAALNSFWDQHARTFSNSAALMYALRAAFPELAPADDRE